MRHETGFTTVPIDQLAQDELCAPFVSRLTADYVTLSLNEGRAERSHYIWTRRPDRSSRWAVVHRDVV